MRLIPVLLAAFVLSSCQNMPQPYMPPEQRQPLEQFRPYRATRVVNMSDPDAPALFVKDINSGLEAGTWRWVGKRPTVRVRPRSIEGIHYVIEFTLPDVTMKDTGPVTLSFYYDDHLLDTITYKEPGQKKYDKAVPPYWIVSGKDALISAEIDKMWTNKEDGTQLGFILTSIGLTQQ